MHKRRPRPKAPIVEERSPAQLALGLEQDARAYLEAAQVVVNLDRTGCRLLTPGYLLVSQAIETTLKAYLLSQNVDPKSLTEFSHQLDAALAAAEDLGFDLDDDDLEEVIGRLSPYHAQHWFRYRAPGLVSLPILGEAVEAAERALAYIHPLIRTGQALRLSN